MSATTTPALATPVGSARWVQMILGLVCMMSIASPQYVWTLFTKPIGATLAADAPTVQVTFTILIVLQTLLSPFQGGLVDRFGPRWLIGIGCVLAGLSWVTASYATSVTALYLTYGLLGGVGTGLVYIGVVGQMVGWFPHNRGFAAGMVAAGYGMGAIVTTFPISDSLAATTWQATLLRFGLIFGVVGAVAAMGLRAPPAQRVPAATRTGDAADVATGTMLRTPVFWLMFVMMALMATTGLMVVSQIATFAADFGITGQTVWGFAAVPLALTIDRFCNGLTRPFFGWVSDRIGRENTMFVAFALEGLAMLVWLASISNPVAFVLLSGLVFFGWGEIFSLFPSTLTDTFGARWATRNYGCLYIAQGFGALFGATLAAKLHVATGSWTPVFSIAIGADFTAAILALAVLKPLRRRYLAR